MEVDNSSQLQARQYRATLTGLCLFRLSPVYTAAIGLVSEERGLSLRFPRFLKKRTDKSLEEASTNEFLASLWRKQEAKAPVEGEGLEGDEKEDEGDDVD